MFLIFYKPGPDAYEIVPNSQLVVARHAYKSNASKYTINGRTSSFTEVTTLLRARGIDLDHKRFLILQVRKRSSVVEIRFVSNFPAREK